MQSELLRMYLQLFIVSQWDNYKERHARWGTAAFSASRSYVDWQRFYWSVDWAWRTE